MLVTVEVWRDGARECPLLVLCWLRDELKEEAEENVDDDEEAKEEEEVVDVDDCLKEVVLEIAGCSVETVWFCLVTVFTAGISHEAEVHRGGVALLWFCWDMRLDSRRGEGEVALELGTAVLLAR